MQRKLNIKRNEMNKDIAVKNYNNYYDGLVRTIGEEKANAIINSLGGEEAVISAPFFNTADSGVAYEGAFTRSVIRMIKIAYNLNDTLPEDLRVSEKAINKVCLLSHIAKVLLYIPNENKWEVTNRGMLYTFNNDLKGALRVGERSILIAMNAGVKFSDLEFEAMRIMDKDGSDDNYSKYYSSPLSMIIRQANEILDYVNKSRNNG